MTELEQARAYLKVTQNDLSDARKNAWCIGGKRIAVRCERAVLAALSWVYEAQDRAMRNAAWTTSANDKAFPWNGPDPDAEPPVGFAGIVERTLNLGYYARCFEEADL